MEKKITKPKIEDLINELLDGEMKENAHDFVAWLRANKFGISTTSNGNSWKATYKGKTVCRILHMTKGWWSVENYPYVVLQKHEELTKKIEELIVRENMQDVIRTYLTARKCRRSVPRFWAKLCDGKADTFAGFKIELFEQEFDNLCKYNAYFDNPGKKAVECMKKICEFKKQNIIDKSVNNNE